MKHITDPVTQLSDEMKFILSIEIAKLRVQLINNGVVVTDSVIKNFIQNVLTEVVIS